MVTFANLSFRFCFLISYIYIVRLIKRRLHHWAKLYINKISKNNKTNFTFIFIATFKHVAKMVAHVNLTDHVIDVVFAMFDENGKSFRK